MIISAKRRGRGHGGWSKNNPYLNERWVEFPIDIHPTYLMKRLLPVRQQLADEFERDLDVILAVDGMINDSYFNQISRGRLPFSSYQPAFERISVHILSNYTEVSHFSIWSSQACFGLHLMTLHTFKFQEGVSSPLRRGNFDLLYSLCTHKAAHELLREIRDDSSSYDELTSDWFKDFYIEHVSEYFDGDQAFGRADDFIDALLRTPPFFVEPPDGNTDGLINPLTLAKRIIGIRSEIAEEWKYLMREVKDDHVLLQQMLTRAMMEKAIESNGPEKGVEIFEERTWRDIPDDIGVFE